MKKLLFLLVTTFSFIQIHSQTETKIDLGHYSKVLDFPNNTKIELFNAINKWLTLNYNSAKDVIQLNNLENGEIVVKGIVNIDALIMFGKGVQKPIHHTLSIKIKENKIKVDLDYNEIVFDYLNSNNNKIVAEYLTHKAIRQKDKDCLIVSMQNHFDSTINSIAKFINTSISNEW